MGNTINTSLHQYHNTSRHKYHKYINTRICIDASIELYTINTSLHKYPECKFRQISSIQVYINTLIQVFVLMYHQYKFI